MRIWCILKEFGWLIILSLLVIEDEDEGWAGHGMSERDVLLRTQKEAEEKRRRDAEKRRTKISQQSLDLEGIVNTI